MKRKKILSFIFLLMLINSLFMPLITKTKAAQPIADGVPYLTQTLGVGNSFVYTQAAYTPYGILNNDDDLTLPEDIYFYNENLYIIDNQKRIMVISKQGILLKEIEFKTFQEPKGIFVRNDMIYVADRKAEKVFKFDLEGNLLFTFARPDNKVFPSFGKNTKFSPLKVAVAENGHLYIASEGTNNGLIELNHNGDFIGFFGINYVTFSLRKLIYNFFVSDSVSSLPPAPTNVTISPGGSIYSININIYETFKRLNIKGMNTLGGDTYYPWQKIADIAVSDENFTFIATQDGQIYEYDSKGNLLFVFDTYDYSKNGALGLTTEISSIDVDSSGNLYVADRASGVIVMYQKTAFTSKLHEAVDLYNDGQYLASKDLWEEILKQNTSFALAHTALGYAYFKEGNNEEALSHFKAAKNFGGYSQVYWQIRNDNIQAYASTVIICLLAIFIVYKIFMVFFKKTHVYANIGTASNSFKKKKLVSELLYSKYMLRHVGDACYGIKREKRASYLSALIILGLFAFTYLLNQFGSGFLFKNQGVGSKVIVQLGIYLGLILLWSAMNYLISILNDGEGWFKDIFISTSYCLLPYIIITIPLTIISNFLTYNESFIFSIANFILVVWTVIYFFLTIQNIHQFTFWQTIKNIFLTIFAMLIFILIAVLLYIFMNQLIEFIISIFKEVNYRVGA